VDLPGSPCLQRQRILRLAFNKRCPRCAERGLFRAWARLAERCACCGLLLRREAGSQTGSMYLTATVTEVVAAAMILLGWTMTDWSVATCLAVSIPVILLFSYWFLPRAQALWVGIEYATDVANGEEWTRGPR
jgi:uncharacterized protein (DUF983 family)